MGASLSLGPQTPTVEEQFAFVPRISIAKFLRGSTEERAQQVSALRSAFEHQGMALLVDHQVPQPSIDACINRCREFFELPRKRKESFDCPYAGTRSYGAVTYPKGKGYVVQAESNGHIVNEWLMVRDCDKPYDASDPYYTCPEGAIMFTPEDRHPSQQVWPEEVPGLQEATGAYYRYVEVLARTMYEMFALALGLEADFFAPYLTHGPIWPVTVAHYPKQESPPPSGTMRIQPHWDRSLFSLITTNDLEEQSQGGGLQILVDRDSGDAVDARARANAVWRNVPIEPGCFVLNSGEMMTRLTNGVFKHVVHRVPNPPPEVARQAAQGRVSVMAYVEPDYHMPIAPLPQCVAEGEQPSYEASWVGEMMNWNSPLPSYDKAKQNRMRLAQGLYDAQGAQTTLGFPTDVTSVGQWHTAAYYMAAAAAAAAVLAAASRRNALKAA